MQELKKTSMAQTPATQKSTDQKSMVNVDVTNPLYLKQARDEFNRIDKEIQVLQQNTDHNQAAMRITQSIEILRLAAGEKPSLRSLSQYHQQKSMMQ
ncbi:MAG TPA: hypothetical protein VN611_16100 [Patescibacteria group bacterium]|nr:hypothetical protein [Patescibacteria group bacterium]